MWNYSLWWENWKDVTEVIPDLWQKHKIWKWYFYVKNVQFHHLQFQPMVKFVLHKICKKTAFCGYYFHFFQNFRIWESWCKGSYGFKIILRFSRLVRTYTWTLRRVLARHLHRIVPQHHWGACGASELLLERCQWFL